VRNIEADVVVHNRDLARRLTITAVQVAPAAAVRLDALQLVDASGPFSGKLSGTPQLRAPVALEADTVKTIRLRFAIIGTCNVALTANPTMSVASHYQGQPTVTTTLVPRGAEPGRGWVLTAVRNCRGL
jgi:hypothetical protein